MLNNKKNQKKQTCKGCPYITVSLTGISYCTVWRRIISPAVTDACIYKTYEKGGDQ